MKVLLACPDRDLLRSLTGILLADGLEVKAVFDGPEAAAAAGERPEIQVLDPALPGADPKKLRQRFLVEGIPTLLLSARPLSAELLKEEIAGALLVYPFSPAEFLETVKEIAAEKTKQEALFGPEKIRAGAFLLAGRVPLLSEEMRLLRDLEKGAGEAETGRNLYAASLNEKLKQIGSPSRIVFEAGKGYQWVTDHE